MGMNLLTENTNKLIAIISVVLGILIFIYPNLVAYIIAFFLVVTGVLEVIK